MVPAVRAIALGRYGKNTPRKKQKRIIRGKMTLHKLRINLLRLAFIPVVFVAVFIRPSWSLDSVTVF